MKTPKPEPGAIVKVNRRDARVTKVEPHLVYFRYKTPNGWSKTERNIYWSEAN